MIHSIFSVGLVHKFDIFQGFHTSGDWIVSRFGIVFAPVSAPSPRPEVNLYFEHWPGVITPILPYFTVLGSESTIISIFIRMPTFTMLTGDFIFMQNGEKEVDIIAECSLETEMDRN